MSSDNAIEIEGVTKRYRRGQYHINSLREELQVAFFKNQRVLGDSSFLALDGVSFSVPEGQIWGVVGPNGSGKTTLMKVLASITHPTEGEIRLRGRVGCLLEVGAGFDPELDGVENIYLSGAILGMSRKEIARKLDRIIRFADIGPVLETPVKRYSSGMYVRLAFAVAAHLEAEILLIDEVLAVGDAEFQRLAIATLKSLAAQGRTILLISHNMNIISQLCQRVVRLEGGRVAEIGNASETADHYLRALAQAPQSVQMDRNVAAWLQINGMRERSSIGFGLPWSAILTVNSSGIVPAVAVLLNIYSEDGTLISTVDTRREGLSPLSLSGSAQIRFDFERCNLLPGQYYVGFSIESVHDGATIAGADAAISLEIAPASVNDARTAYDRRHGVVRLVSAIKITNDG